MDPISEIPGTSEQAAAIRAFVAEAARSEVPVLLVGETGTGKTFLAAVIHAKSRRCPGSFVPVDLATIPASLVQSELFGCRKGAFTGAVERRGLVRAADRGTLFLDEIANVPPEVQACLLQLLDQKTVRAMGGERWERVDCRIIAATHGDLKARIAAGAFREDLYFRLRGQVLRLPPLRERGEDVVIVARRWLAERAGGRMRLSSSAEQHMLEHAWPGNFRELRHRLEVAVSTARGGLIEPELLGLPGSDPGLSLIPAVVTESPGFAAELLERLVAATLAGRVRLSAVLEELERKAIFRAIKEEGSLRAAARRLGLSYSTLQSKLEKLAKGGDRCSSVATLTPKEQLQE